jgi:SgrR family transcriptional regulator
MSSRRLEQQYWKLYERFGAVVVETTLQELAGLLCCTRRHMRNLLGQMEAEGWIQWQSSAGRGHRSSLSCRYDPQQLRQRQAESLLAQGQVEQAVRLLGTEPEQLTPLLLRQLGATQQQERQILRVPYYRPMPNLYPGLPLRRSEAHLVHQIFNGLTRINEENGEIEADLAHHWHSPDDRHWTFYLRPSVRFHDGRLLQVADVVASLQRVRSSPLYAHVQAIQAQGERVLCIDLSCADPRLPWLLADVMAMILPRDHGERADFASRPVGTGPYRVVENNPVHLRLQAFDDYFGWRALLDEVDIWMLPELAEQLELGERQVCGLEVLGELPSGVKVPRRELAASTSAPEMVLEQGGYFLLCDSRSPYWQAPATRRWLHNQLNPYLLMAQVPLTIRRYWAPAASLLPNWLHEQSSGPERAPWAADTKDECRLRLAYYEQQPEYRMLAEVMRSLLAEQGITLELVELAYSDWQQGEEPVDLWLGSVNFAAPSRWSLGVWLLGNPLLRRSITGGDMSQLQQWHDAWRSEQLDSERLMEQVVAAGWLQPLFHHWLRLQGPAQARGIRLNNLGWFDFKSAWLTPEASTRPDELLP